ncbi:hypothetical protein EYF80_028954 [Liparis tanakae]|uniref:Uncharacterized protein n=1 Tax=Liparis tanakae TaxID=230148 RepID=A0A4Z2H7H9_9TELE|nr:hypothetical protein EYF80_028954 [Liparis tanakae]
MDTATAVCGLRAVTDVRKTWTGIQCEFCDSLRQLTTSLGGQLPLSSGNEMSAEPREVNRRVCGWSNKEDRTPMVCSQPDDPAPFNES